MGHYRSHDSKITNMNFRNYLYLAILGFSILSCEETIQLDLDQTSSRIVIEGLLTNKLGHSYVVLTKTTPFYDEKGQPRVTGAKIEITTTEGDLIMLQETKPGLYQPPSNFVGVVGQTYVLQVEVDGQIYTATETMSAVNSFDSLTYWQPPNLDDDDAIEASQFYELLVYYTEPQGIENYYQFKFYRNQEILDFNGTGVFVYDDESIAENIEGLATPEYYALGDTGRIEVFGLSRRAFRYYMDINNNINSDGGMFSGIPANAGTNIVGDAIGYFQVSAMEDIEIVVKE